MKILSVENKFGDWLLQRLKEKGWTQSELARRAGLSRGTLSNIINGERGVGENTLIAVAHVLGYPPETVFRAAGILPPAKDRTPEIDAVIEAMNDLPLSWQAMIAADARRTREFYEQQERERLDRDRATLLRKKDTGKLPPLP